MIGPGYTGLEAALRFVSKGWRVYVLCRNPAKAPAFQKAGLDVLAGDLLKPQTLPAFPSVDFILFSAAPEGHSEADYRAVYVDGLQNTLSRVPDAKKIIGISSTSVFEENASGWVDESVMPRPREEKPRLLLEAENRLLNSRFPSLVFRLSGIYGPGRNRLSAFREGRWPEPGTSLRYLNLIHREDIVRGLDFLFEKGLPGEVYLGTDTEPFTNRQLAEWLAVHSPRTLPLPVLGDGAPAGKRCRPARLQALGFQFCYPTFREGYKALIADCERTHESS